MIGYLPQHFFLFFFFFVVVFSFFLLNAKRVLDYPVSSIAGNENPVDSFIILNAVTLDDSDLGIHSI